MALLTEIVAGTLELMGGKRIAGWVRANQLIKDALELGLRARQLTSQDNIFDIYQRNSMYNEAIRLCTQALEIQPNNLSALFIRASSLRCTDKHYESIKDLDLMIGLNPQDPFLYLCRGEEHLELNQTREAIVDFTSAIVLYPENYESFFERGMAYLYMGEYERSIFDLTRSLEIMERHLPDWAFPIPFLYVDRAIAQVGLGRLDLAEADLETASDCSPSRPNLIQDRVDWVLNKISDPRVKIQILEMVEKYTITD